MGKYQPAGVFVMTAKHEDTTTWHVTAPGGAAEAAPRGAVPIEDVTELDALDPEPTSVRDVKRRLGWGTARSLAALNAWREQVS